MDSKWKDYRHVRNLCAVWSYGRCTAYVPHEHTLFTRLFKRFTQWSSDWRAWNKKVKLVGRRGRRIMITTHLGSVAWESEWYQTRELPWLHTLVSSKLGISNFNSFSSFPLHYVSYFSIWKRCWSLISYWVFLSSQLSFQSPSALWFFLLILLWRVDSVVSQRFCSRNDFVLTQRWTAFSELQLNASVAVERISKKVMYVRLFFKLRRLQGKILKHLLSMCL